MNAAARRGWRCLAAVAALAAAAATPAQELAEDSAQERCRSLVATQPQQAVAVCEQAFAAIDARREFELAEEMLFRRSDAEVASGDFAAAAATLDRVAALPAEAAHWKHDFRLARRRGILDYRQERFVQALQHFRVAQEVALAHDDSTALAQSQNDVGNALRRVGDYREALKAYLSSLELKRRINDPQLGAVYTNLGDLYHDLEDDASARSRYADALAEYERMQRPREAAHVRESLAAVLISAGETAEADKLLRKAISDLAALGARANELDAQVKLAALAQDRGDAASAHAALARAQALGKELDQPATAQLALQLARLKRSDGDIAGARALLADTLQRLGPQAAERALLLQAAAETAKSAGDLGAAYSLLLEFQTVQARLDKAAHDRRLEHLRVQFDLAERERALEKLATDNRLAELALRQRTTQLWLGAACALLVLLALAFAFVRARQRSRLAAAVRESQLAAEREHFRRLAESLRTDSRRVQDLLDRAGAALLAMDPAGGIVALTAAAAERLGSPREAVLGRPLAAFLGADSAAALQAALSALEEKDGEIELPLQLPGGAARASLSALPGDAGIAVLRLVAADVTADIAAQAAAAAPPPLAVLAAADQDDSLGFRRELVELMVFAVETWERVSGRTRIDLAEKSRVWRVTVDEGRLRVRAMERYLSLSKLPRQPRWREVLRTAYFVLSECRLEPAERDALKQCADAVQASLRRRALI